MKFMKGAIKKTLPAIASLTDHKLAMSMEESADGEPKERKKSLFQKASFQFGLSKLKFGTSEANVIFSQ